MCPRSRMCIVVLLALACLAGVSDAGGWHQFQKDSRNTGITSDAAPRSDPELVWSMQTGSIDVPPIIAGDLVYVYDANGTIRAFDKKSGDPVWRNDIRRRERGRSLCIRCSNRRARPERVYDQLCTHLPGNLLRPPDLYRRIVLRGTQQILLL
jgi:hypothetical protein